MKECRRCKESKELTDFYKSTSRTKGGYRHECKSCWNRDSLKYYNDNREEIIEKRKDYHYLKNYNITRADFHKMQEEAGGCEVCGDTNTVLDHCHDSSEIRGVLCNRCNQALGLMRDDPVLIRGLADYMDRHMDKKT